MLKPIGTDGTASHDKWINFPISFNITGYNVVTTPRSSYSRSISFINGDTISKNRCELMQYYIAPSTGDWIKCTETTSVTASFVIAIGF
jgi:hypothetical protein